MNVDVLFLCSCLFQLLVGAHAQRDNAMYAVFMALCFEILDIFNFFVCFVRTNVHVHVRFTVLFITARIADPSQC